MYESIGQRRCQGTLSYFSLQSSRHSIVETKKNALDKVDQTMKTLFKVIAIGERNQN